MKNSILPFPTGDLEPQHRSKTLNNHLISRSVEYGKELPFLLSDKIILVREYFLTEVLPLFLALDTGMDDATDVVRLTLDDEPSASSFESMLRDATIEALAIKLTSFVINYVGLDKEQATLFMMTFISRTLKGADHGHVAEALMRKMQQIPELPRPSKDKAPVLVREVQKANGDSRRKRTDGDEPNDSPRGRRGPASKTAAKAKEVSKRNPRT